jgi:hypothetical protein
MVSLSALPLLSAIVQINAILVWFKAILIRRDYSGEQAIPRDINGTYAYQNGF